VVVKGSAGKLWRAAALSAGLLLGGCQDKAEAPKKKVVYNGPTMVTTNVTTLFSDSARLQVRLNAPLENTYENGDLEYPKGMELTFYAKDGTTVVNTLRGNYGKFTRGDNQYVTRGNVQVRNEAKQQSLNTEELFYDRPRGRIYTQKETQVRVQTPTEILTGNGLEANEDFSRYRILKPTGVFSVEQSTEAPQP
jgi:LPS export ABC transporter protein LptC